MNRMILQLLTFADVTSCVFNCWISINIWELSQTKSLMEIKYVNLYIPHSWLTDLNYNILITVPIVVAARVSKSVNKNIIAMGVIYFSYSRI